MTVHKYTFTFMVNSFLTREPIQFNGRKTASSTDSTGAVALSHAKNLSWSPI